MQKENKKKVSSEASVQNKKTNKKSNQSAKSHKNQASAKTKQKKTALHWDVPV